MRPASHFMNKENGSANQSVSGSLNEKISMMMKNYEGEEDRETNSLITIEDRQVDNEVKHFNSVTSDTSFMGDLQDMGLSRQPLSVKREENQDYKIMDKMRKRMCKKIFQKFREMYTISVNDAQKTALSLEERVNNLYPSYSSSQLYISTIKNLFNKLKVREV